MSDPGSERKAPARGIRSVTLNDRESSTDRSHESVELTDDGSLLISGHDLGETPKAFWGSSDYEYWRRIAARDVPRVLLGLIRQRFDSHADFHAWLEANDIDSTFDSWVSSD
jgi:hypothetical protein